MVHLTFEYSKKIGLKNYSSHSYQVSLTSEVSNPEQVSAEAERVYEILQNSVDSQIINEGYVPGNVNAPGVTNGRSTSQNGSTHHHGNGNGRYPQNSQQHTHGTSHWQCSEKQKNLITDILHRNNLDLPVVDDLAVELHGKPMAQLTKLEASGVVGEIISRYGRRQPANSNTGGNSR